MFSECLGSESYGHQCSVMGRNNMDDIILAYDTTRGPRTLTLCLTAAVGMTLAIFCRVQTCIKNSLLQTKSIEICVNCHTVPRYACINFRSYSTP